MNRPTRNRPKSRRRVAAKSAAANELWRVPEGLPDVAPITQPADVSSLVRSLGDPPMSRGHVAGNYFEAVVVRAATVATAVALSADLLAQPEPDLDL